MAATHALVHAVGSLRCPTCSAAVALDEPDHRTLRCRAGHAFDIARQGYVNLLGRAAPQNADTADMVAARDRFLDAGHFQPVADVLHRRLGSATRLVDAGGGTGWYSAQVLQQRPDAHGISIDISPMASRRAARAHERLAAVVADTWQPLPLADGAADALLCVFAPRNPAEFTRLLRRGGVLAVVAPNPGHLASARDRLGLIGLQDDKQAKVQRAFSGFLEPIATQRVTAPLVLDATAASDLVAMGPNAHHAHAVVADAAPAGLTTELDVQVSVFRKPVG